ncbi:putative signal peptide protein [Puccinia sorghi]|uniref:Putative signal peptide protein n=1 Tax=Puccinia sorghi TaxID=27349 RepID=A0A0L6VKG0_9BASI|nr:putative signal peptide protein [Puccinia sorghi]
MTQLHCFSIRKQNIQKARCRPKILLLLLLLFCKNEL